MSDEYDTAEDAVERWVHEVNRLARELDSMCRNVHPTDWPSLRGYNELRAQYLAVARSQADAEA